MLLAQAISRLRAHKKIPRVMEKATQRKLKAQLRAINRLQVKAISRLRVSQQSMREL